MIFLTGLTLLVLCFFLSVAGAALKKDKLLNAGAAGVMAGALTMATSVCIAFFRFAWDYLP